ncbi:hypothetical protein ACHQM5_011351 [Ranunculus cassubicifolius]
MASNNLAKKLSFLQQATVTQALKAFTNMHALKQTHAHILKSNLPPHIFHFITSRLLTFAAISNSGDLSYAKTLFDSVHYPDLFMYNTLFRGFSQCNQPSDALQLFVEMLRNGVSPNHITYPFLIRSCTLCSSTFLGRQVYGQVLRFGFCLDVYVVNNLINMYCSCGELGDARRVFEEGFSVVNVVSWTTLITGYLSSGAVEVARRLFDEMPCRNEVTWGAMIYGYACNGKIVEAREVFDEMPEKNAEVWSAMVSGYSHCQMAEEALGIFRDMVRVGVVPNNSALVSALSACTQLKALEQGEWIHDYIEEHVLQVDVGVGTALVDMFGKCGNVEKAYHVFKQMRIKNVTTWSIMINSMFLNGCGKQALSLFWRMHEMGPPPNSITFVGVISGCSHSGLVREGCQIFNIMTQEYHIEPQPEHYGCMVDLLGRAGLVKEALDFVKKMPVEPDPGLLGALVGACKIHGEIELGEEIGKHLIELEQKHSGRYMLLSNMLAAAERWEDVATTRNLLKERQVVKNPGSSIVET